MDEFISELAGAYAVRERRTMLTNVISKMIVENNDDIDQPLAPLQITSMACGPAREVYDILSSKRPKF